MSRKTAALLEIEVWTRSIDCGGQAAELAFAVDVTERRAFGQALMDAIGGEQRRIAEEMHDGLGQELTGLALSVRALANRAQKERDAISVELDQLALLATSCIQDAHRIVQGLSPLTNAEGNLEAALEGLAKRSSLSGHTGAIPRPERPPAARPQSSQSLVSHRPGGSAERIEAFRRKKHRDRAVGAPRYRDAYPSPMMARD